VQVSQNSTTYSKVGGSSYCSSLKKNDPSFFSAFFESPSPFDLSLFDESSLPEPSFSSSKSKASLVLAQTPSNSPS